MKLLPDSKIAYLTKKLNACVGIISKLLISPPRHGRYWAVKPIALPGDNSPKKIPARETLPWVPEAFHARFPVSPLVSSAKDRRRIGLRPTKLLVTREKKPLVPRVGKLVFKKNPARGDT